MKSNYQTLKSLIEDEAHVLAISDENAAGTVYTPDKVSRNMVYMLLVTYFKKKDMLNYEWELLLNQYIKSDFEIEGLTEPPKETGKQTLMEFLDRLEALSLMDMACGTGNLIFAYAELLSMLMKCCGMDSDEIGKRLQSFFEHRVYAFDVNPVAISLFEEAALAFISQYKITNTANLSNIRLRNSLLSDDIIKVDLIIGNPPYIGEKGHRAVFAEIRASEWGKQHYEGKMDYFYFFIYKAYDFLKEDGVLCFLTSNYFFTADGAQQLRAFIQTQFFMGSLLDYSERQVFNKKLHACIYTLSKERPKTVRIYESLPTDFFDLEYTMLFEKTGNISIVGDQLAMQMLTKLEMCCTEQLDAICKVSQGIVTGADRDDKMPVFVYRTDEIQGLPKSLGKLLRPFYKNSAIKQMNYDPQNEFCLLDARRESLGNEEIQDISAILSPFYDKLSKRREVVKGTRAWYELTWPRDGQLFLKPKIVAPQRAKRNYFAYVKEPFYASADVYFITLRDELLSCVEADANESEKTLKALAAYLNSDMVLLYLAFRGKRKGKAFELYATPLKGIPVSDSVLNKLKMLEGQSIEAINEFLYEFFELTDEEIKWLRAFGRMHT